VRFVLLYFVYTVLLGCNKLNINNYGCKVVLEDDGTEIDDDESLEAWNGSTLMILQSDEDWKKQTAEHGSLTFT